MHLKPSFIVYNISYISRSANRAVDWLAKQALGRNVHCWICVVSFPGALSKILVEDVLVSCSWITNLLSRKKYLVLSATWGLK